MNSKNKTMFLNLISLFTIILEIRLTTNLSTNKIRNLREDYKNEFQAFIGSNPSRNKNVETIKTLKEEINVLNEQRISCESTLCSLKKNNPNYEKYNTIIFHRFYESLVKYCETNIEKKRNDMKMIEEYIYMGFLLYLQKKKQV